MNARLQFSSTTQEVPPVIDDVLLQLLTAQRQGQGCLPAMLGLDEMSFKSFLKRCVSTGLPSNNDACAHRGELRQQLLEMRRDEWKDLRDLLLMHRRDGDTAELWLADIIAAGCLGGDHLWRDLGLPTRAALHDLLHTYFPALATKNIKDMRWKKFFYKQMCEGEGSYVCRSPSCEQCAIYADCFGEEN